MWTNIWRWWGFIEKFNETFPKSWFLLFISYDSKLGQFHHWTKVEWNRGTPIPIRSNMYISLVGRSVRQGESIHIDSRNCLQKVGLLHDRNQRKCSWVSSVLQKTLIRYQWILDQAQVMLQKLNNESIKVSLKMNLSKTIVMTNVDSDSDIKFGDSIIESVGNYYVYWPKTTGGHTNRHKSLTSSHHKGA